MAGVAQAAERLTVNQIVAGSSPATRPEMLGCRLTGRTVVFEAICRGSNPRIPVLRL
jgi:hypothetical protein